MQFVGTLVSGLFGAGGGAAAAGAVEAGTGAVAAGSAASSVSALTLLQGAGSVFSALASFGAGRAARDEAEAAAAEERFAARDEYIQGLEQKAAIKRELLSTVANQRVAFAASGIDLSSISVDQAERQATADAEHELSVNSAQAQRNALARRRRARNLVIRGNNAFSQGIVGGISEGIKFGIDVQNRGGFAA